MIECNVKLTTKVAVVAALFLPPIILWIWLVQDAIRTSYDCPENCWCASGDMFVDCKNASLQDIPQGLHKELEHLALRYNNISKLRRNHFLSANLLKLEILTLEYNGINTIESGAFNNLPALTDLHLQGNNISELKIGVFANLTQLTGLHIAGNKIKLLPPGVFEDLENLKYISLENNELDELSEYVFIGLENLRSLYLDENKIKHLEPNILRPIPKIILLSLSGNKELIVPVDKPFINKSTLHELDISACNIKTLSTKTFELMPNLTEISAVNNSLTTFDITILQNLTKLTTLELYGNPFKCDCKLKEVWKWCHQYKIRVGIANNSPKCNSPHQVSGLWWGVLDNSECSGDTIKFIGDYKSVVPAYIPYNEEYEELWEFVKYTETIVIGLLFIIGAIGNITVLVIIGCNKRMRIVPNAYIFNLAVGDLLSLIMNLPVAHAVRLTSEWNLGTFMCKLGFFSRHLSIGVSAFSVAVLSMQRYYATSGSDKLSTKRSTTLTIAGVWIIASCCAIPSGFSVHTHSETYCTPFFNLVYYRIAVMFHLMVFGILPLAVISSMYVMTARLLVQSANKAQNVPKATKTLVKIVIGLAIVFMISYLPYHLMLTAILWMDADFSASLGYAYFAFVCLLALNPCLNPVSLCFTSVTFRRLFKRYLLCHNRKATDKEEESDFLEGYEGVVHFRKEITNEVILQ